MDIRAWVLGPRVKTPGVYPPAGTHGVEGDGACGTRGTRLQAAGVSSPHVRASTVGSSGSLSADPSLVRLGVRDVGDDREVMTCVEPREAQPLRSGQCAQVLVGNEPGCSCYLRE